MLATRWAMLFAIVAVSLWTMGCTEPEDDDDATDDDTGDDDTGDDDTGDDDTGDDDTGDDDVGDDDTGDDDSGDDDVGDDDTGDDDVGDDDSGDDDSGDDDTAAYHPPGWFNPGDHGPALKDQVEDCRVCHGADLTGGITGQSCDDCHPADWRTDCTFCHGGTDNNLGSPPVDLHDDTATSLQTVGAHTAHVTQTYHLAYDCTECHVKPVDVLSIDHVFDSTPGEAELDLSAGLSGAGQYTDPSCSNLYCHGNLGQDNGSMPDYIGSISTCDACHPDWTSSESDWDNLMSGKHKKHLQEPILCSECHSDSIDGANAIIAPDLHVNGSVEVNPVQPVTWDSGSGTCSGGVCHGENHNNANW